MKQHTLMFRPLGLAMPCIGEYRVVNSVHSAATTLLQHWPVDDGEDFADAIIACLDAIYGQTTLERVRSALLRAAAEANVSVLEVAPVPHLGQMEMVANIA
ncbi:hypothetical protein ASE04_23380 [Rhizobium sp. Root708]|uniref:DUF982 domain-containing protein n=1 Tax=Rhizobium sp. Root708 TaxID=1736592 RepID=UPI0006F1DA01|nr:DUF982 domain-containing protein [Rhizobium sp. Root708]KRB60661.1 hypothetical protein ASE04_23380 [Rhizobium sp. Root708]